MRAFLGCLLLLLIGQSVALAAPCDTTPKVNELPTIQSHDILREDSIVASHLANIQVSVHDVRNSSCQRQRTVVLSFNIYNKWQWAPDPGGVSGQAYLNITLYDKAGRALPGANRSLEWPSSFCGPYGSQGKHMSFNLWQGRDDFGADIDDIGTASIKSSRVHGKIGEC
jgi:hypothetical protein